MPTVKLDPTLMLHYEDDCFADPWNPNPEAILLVHGVAESSRAWYAWVPHLAQRYRVLRPDQRGFGRSTVPPPDYRWSLQSFAGDLAAILDALHLRTVHVVGAKLGGSIAYQFAADFPERTRSLTVVSGPVRLRDAAATGKLQPDTLAGHVRAVGFAAFAAESMRTRLGSDAPEEQILWWNSYMAQADPSVAIEVTAAAVEVDIAQVLPRIQAPTLVVTTEGSALAPVAGMREYQRMIPNSEFLVIASDSYHVAAARPDEVASSVLAFIDRHSAS